MTTIAPVEHQPVRIRDELPHPTRPDRRFWWAVGVITTVAVALRVLTVIGYAPANLSYSDTGGYIHAASGGLGGLFTDDPFHPAGYSLFLRVLHALGSSLQFTVIVQHALGLATAAGVYLVCRLAGARRGVALVPAAVVALSGDQLYFEHELLSDGLFLTGLVLACYLILRRPSRWDRVQLCAASVTVASLGLVRTVGVPLVPVLLLWLFATSGPRWRHRLVRTGIAAVACLVPLLGYAAVQKHETGVFGLSRFSGWPLYGRAAPFADCHDFTPPAGTAVLCETTPASTRNGPDYYVWDARSPASRAFGSPPAHGGEVKRFAIAAIEHQPLAYIGAVARDLARYVDPHLVTRPYWGVGSSSLALDTNYVPSGHAGVDAQLAHYESLNVQAARAYWGPFQVRVRKPIMRFLEGWQHIFRIHGALIALCGVLSLAGLVWAPRGCRRQALWLLVAFSLTLFLDSVAFNVYQARYGVPAAVLLLAAATLSAEIIAARVAGRFRRVPEAAPA